MPASFPIPDTHPRPSRMESLAKAHQSTCPSDWLKDHPGAEEGNQEPSPEEELLSAECELVNTLPQPPFLLS